MSVSTGELVAQIFTTANPTTGAAADADSLPTGVLWIDGVADAATVTIADAAGTGRYTFSVTMPSLTTGQRVSVVVAATIASVACAGEVWADQCSPAVNVTLWKGDVPGDLDVDGNVPTASGGGATADDLWDEVVDETYTARQLLRLLASALAAKSSGGGTTVVTFRDVADTKDRIVATVDAGGNRTAVTLTAT